MKRIHNKPQLYAMVRILAESVGDTLNHNGLAKNLGLSITAIENYLGIIEKAFYVKKIDPYYQKMNKEIRKMPKLYFLDNGIRNLVLNNFSLPADRIDKEGFFENIVFKVLLGNRNVKEINYWRTQTKHEVDFIINRKLALETKYNSNLFKISKFKQFLTNYKEIPLRVVAHLNIKESEFSVYDLI
jgi:predicted AAA+ superfamily ATPase